MVRIGDHEVPKSERFCYLRSILQNNERLDGDINIEYKRMDEVQKCIGCVVRQSYVTKSQGKIYKMTIRSVMFYCT